MIFPVATLAQERRILSVAVKTTCAQFSTLPSKKKLPQSASKESSTQRDRSPSLAQITMNPSSSRTRGMSSMDDPTQYHAMWSNAVRQSAAMNVTPCSSNLDSGSIPETEFDPILNIRLMNPLIFENNYDLDEYGPSFREKTTNRQNAIISEWRIRHEGSL